MGASIGTWPLILGQVMEPQALHSSGPSLAVILIPLAGIVALVLVVGMPVVLGIRSEARRREMEHTERMRAIELGRPIPGEAGWWTPARLAGGVGVAVPIAALAIAWVASLTSDEAAPFVWPSAGAVGVAAVICGTVLAARLSEVRAGGTDPHAKPRVNPDAFDAAEHQHA